MVSWLSEDLEDHVPKGPGLNLLLTIESIFMSPIHSAFQVVYLLVKGLLIWTEGSCEWGQC